MRERQTVDDIEDELLITPDSQELLERYSRHLLNEGRISKTIEVCSHLLQLAPSNGKARVRLAEALLRYGETEKALNEFRTAFVKQGVEARKTAFVTAICLFIQKQLSDEALCIAERAVALNPNNKELLCLYAVSLSACKRGDEAYETFEKVVEIDSNFKELLPSIQEGFKNCGNPKLRILLADQQISVSWLDTARDMYNLALRAELADNFNIKIRTGQLRLIEAYLTAERFKEALQVLEEIDISEVDKFRLKSKITRTSQEVNARVSVTNVFLDAIYRRAMALGSASGDSAESFWSWATEIQWFSEVGNKSNWLDDFTWQVADADSGSLDVSLCRVTGWDDYPTDDFGIEAFDEEIGALLNSLSERHSGVDKSFKQKFDEIKPLITEQIDKSKYKKRFKAFDHICGCAAYAATLVREFLQVNEPVPDILKLTWCLFASGRIVCGYPEDGTDEADRGCILVF